MIIKREITKIPLDDGTEIMVIDLKIKATYADVWAGLPNPQLNRNIVNSMFRYPSEWLPSQKVLVLRPKPEILNSILPAYRITAWLDCNKTKDPELDGSSLVVSWFTDDLLEVGINDLLYKALRDIDWLFSSQDYFI